MPKTTVQQIIFGLLMSYFMAIGMEIYNTAINSGVTAAGGRIQRPLLRRRPSTP